MASLCHPWFTTTNLSYRFPIFETSATALCGTTGIYNSPVLRAKRRKNCNSEVVVQACHFATKGKTRDYHYDHTSLPKQRDGISKVQILPRYIGFISRQCTHKQSNTMKWQFSVSIWFWVMVWFCLLWGSSKICFRQPELRLSKRDGHLITHVLAAWAQGKACTTTRCVLSTAKSILSWTMQTIEFNCLVFLSSRGRNNFPPTRSSTSSLHTARRHEPCNQRTYKCYKWWPRAKSVTTNWLPSLIVVSGHWPSQWGMGMFSMPTTLTIRSDHTRNDQSACLHPAGDCRIGFKTVSWHQQ